MKFLRARSHGALFLLAALIFCGFAGNAQTGNVDIGASSSSITTAGSATTLSPKHILV